MVQPVTGALGVDPRAPVAGALVWVDFDGARGSEQAGLRLALVVSATTLNQVSQRSMVCPITSNVTPFPTKVLLPEGLPVSGAVLADQIRTMDRATRGFRLIGHVPRETLEAVRGLIAEFLSDDGPA